MSEERKDGIIFIFCYLLTWLSGIIVYVMYGSENKDLRFHSVQAILLGVVIFVIGLIPSIFPLVLHSVSWILELVVIILWLYGIYVGYRAYKGFDITMPVIGDLAK